VPSGELVHPFDELLLEFGGNRLVALGRAVLVADETGPALRYAVASDEIGDRILPARRAHHFSRSRSFSIEMSSACSATIFLRRAFSCSRAFRALGLVLLQRSILETPAVEGLVRYLKALTSPRNRQALSLELLRLP
jgi:hypothetical protein